MIKNRNLEKFNKLYQKCLDTYKKLNIDSFLTEEKKEITEKINELKTEFEKNKTTQEVLNLLKKDNALAEIKQVLDDKGVSDELNTLLAKLDISSLESIFEEKNRSLEEIETINNEIEQLFCAKKSTIKQTELTIREEELNLKEEDFYNRKQIAKRDRNYFGRIVFVLIYIIIIVFSFFLLPSIKKRIEYNPYEKEQLDNECRNKDCKTDINISINANDDNIGK